MKRQMTEAQIARQYGQPNGNIHGVGKKGRSGRPPKEIREKLRSAFWDRIKTLEQIADDTRAKRADRMKAIDLLAKYGLGTTVTETDTDGNDVTIRVIREPRAFDRN